MELGILQTVYAGFERTSRATREWFESDLFDKLIISLIYIFLQILVNRDNYKFLLPAYDKSFGCNSLNPYNLQLHYLQTDSLYHIKCNCKCNLNRQFCLKQI